jgi:hypothetical protein
MKTILKKISFLLSKKTETNLPNSDKYIYDARKENCDNSVNITKQTTVSLENFSGGPLEFIPAQNQEEATYIVLGCPRGGTSLISGLLRILGVWMGDELGHQHENKEAFARTVPLNTKLQKIRMYDTQFKKWGWKEPNTVHWIHEVKSALRNPHFIVVYRNPIDIALSSARRDKRDFSDKLLNVPINHYKKMHRFLKKNNDPRLYVSFESGLRNKEALVEKMAAFVGVELTDELMKTALNFIDPKRGYKKF